MACVRQSRLMLSVWFFNELSRVPEVAAVVQRVRNEIIDKVLFFFFGFLLEPFSCLHLVLQNPHYFYYGLIAAVGLVACIIVLATVYFSRRKRTVYLVDFAVWAGMEELKVCVFFFFPFAAFIRCFIFHLISFQLLNSSFPLTYFDC